MEITGCYPLPNLLEVLENLDLNLVKYISKSLLEFQCLFKK